MFEKFLVLEETFFDECSADTASGWSHRIVHSPKPNTCQLKNKIKSLLKILQITIYLKALKKIFLQRKNKNKP